MNNIMNVKTTQILLKNIQIQDKLRGKIMKIGIDIDNTLTKVQDKLNKAAFDYAISLGKKIDNYDN